MKSPVFANEMEAHVDENTTLSRSISPPRVGVNVQPITVQELPSGIPWHLYIASAGVAAIIMAVAVYFLRIRKPKIKQGRTHLFSIFSS